MLELNLKNLTTIVNSMMEIFHEINYFYKTMKKFNELLNIDTQKDNFRVNID
jgi:hypothetical protein